VPPSIPKGTNAGALADWAEITLLRAESGTLAETRIMRLLKGEASDLADEELGEAAPDLDRDDVDVDEQLLGEEAEVARDVRMEVLLEEVELRTRLGYQIYPFRAGGDRIEKHEVCGESIYLLLLVLSSTEASYRDERRAHEVEAAYDLVGLEALKRYLGRGAEGVRFARGAHDPDDPHTRPKKFRAAIEWLRDRLDLKRGVRIPPDWEIEVHWEFADVATDADREILNSYKDGGADIVVWWRFRDDRPGFPVLLGQCTVQVSWEDKLEDINVDLWGKWIDFSTVPPQRALVIPFAEDRESPHWADRTVRAGVIVDRLRILELLDELDCDALRRLVEREVRDWIDRELASMP
jgi:hypothetical protein